MGAEAGARNHSCPWEKRTCVWAAEAGQLKAERRCSGRGRWMTMTWRAISCKPTAGVGGGGEGARLPHRAVAAEV
jgi:hypothetical protein